MNKTKSSPKWLLLLALLLSACATVPVIIPPSESLFRDQAFVPPSVPVAPDRVFEMTAAMRHYADREIRQSMRHGKPEQVLVDALSSEGRLRLDYDSVQTRTAAEAFEARAANCLSLVIMTASFAKYLGMPVRFQDVYNAETWSRSGQLELASGHVNITLSHARNDIANQRDDGPGLTVDFLPSAVAARQRSRAIGEATILAMYMNNRAAELLAEGKLNDAYWWAREAIQRTPKFLASYNTLGVIYHQHGDIGAAEQLLRFALAMEPENTIPMSNLVGVLSARGKTTEADALAQQLARIDPQPPFYFYDLGMAALKVGDYKTAKDNFQRELNREAYLPEANFWLGIAAMQLGETGKAERHIERAVENSITLDTRAIYSAKLDWLRSQGYRRDGG